MVKLINKVDESPVEVEFFGPDGYGTKVVNYFNYITPKVSDDPIDNPNPVFVAFVFERKGLEAMLANPDYDGIRCYLARDDNGDENSRTQQKTVSLLAVPVIKQIHDDGQVSFINQLSDKDIILHPECRSTHCSESVDKADELFSN